ncbi:ABC transporter substrate-binding protein [Streptomyces sp. NPDC002755]|uniref:ABC transporter substrate-binding protein n=1 Tax=Streptomyces sp. NPDC002884 TaxID=3154544 RepID=UPI003326BDCF
MRTLPPHALRSAAVPALALSLAAVLAGCGTGTGTSNAGASASPKAGGSLKIAIDSDPVCLDPQQSTLIASAVINRQIVDSLIAQDPGTGKFVSWLADTWKASTDAKSFTFHLRPGITFSDGTPVDAAAVKANFDAIVAAGAKSPYGSQYLLGYTGTQVKDAQNLTVTFDRPNAQFLMAASTPTLGLLSTGSLKTSLADRCTGKGLIGSGPFTFSSYTRNSSTTIVKRTGYKWPSALDKHTGDAYLDKATYNVVGEPSVRSGSLKSGQVDVATTLLPTDESTLKSAGYTLLARVNPGVVIGAAPNLKSSKILQDADVREAIQLAIDRQQITDTVLSPSYGVAKSILGSTTPGFTDLAADLEADPAEAAALLDADGWKKGSDGIRAKNGKKLSISLLYFYQPNVIEAVQQQLRAVGIDLKLKQVTAAEYAAASAKGDYDLRSTSVSRPDPDILRAMFSKSAGNLDWFTGTEAQQAQLEKLLAAQLATTDTAERNKLAAQAQEILIKEGYAFPFSQLTQVVGISSKITGIRYDAASRILLYDAGRTS